MDSPLVHQFCANVEQLISFGTESCVSILVHGCKSHSPTTASETNSHFTLLGLHHTFYRWNFVHFSFLFLKQIVVCVLCHLNASFNCKLFLWTGKCYTWKYESKHQIFWSYNELFILNTVFPISSQCPSQIGRKDMMWEYNINIIELHIVLKIFHV